ncbi:DUF2963 domain-containing protein [Candidatus Phytoplasma solani]
MLNKKNYYQFNNSIYEYNSQNQLIKKTNCNFDGSICNYSIFEYNTQGQLTKITNYKPDGSILDYIIYEYLN